MTTSRWLYAWGLGSVAAGGASLLVPLSAVELGAGLVLRVSTSPPGN